MKRFRWLSGHLVSLAIASGGPACRHPSPEPPGEAKVACEPMGPEGYEYVRDAPPPSDEAWGKFRANALSMAQLVYKRAHGDPATWDDPTDGFLRYAGITCVPKEWRTSVWVKRGGFERIEAAGFRVHYGSGADDSGSVTLSPSRLFDFASHPDVVGLGDSAGIGKFQYELDTSGVYIGASPLRAAHPNATGAGTVVALIDSGIDWTHGTFLNLDGTTKILAIWDRKLTAGPGETAGRGGIGVVYTANDINFSLRAAHDASATLPPVRVRHRDIDGEAHGTLVAGIAAGNGRPVKCCGSEKSYVGIAPEASIIVVTGDFTYDGPELKTVFDFIAGRPEVAGRPIVVNMSQGGTLGPHDGTSPMDALAPRWDLTAAATRGEAEQALRAHLAAHPDDASRLQVVPSYEVAA